MELMSPLLLCALVLVPQALGTTTELSNNNNVNSSLIVKRIVPKENNIAERKNFTTSISKLSNLNSVFLDKKCKTCLVCMERAIKAHNVHNRYDAIENYNNKIDNQRNKRDKRKTKMDVNDKAEKKSKKSKSSNNKTINIIKYNVNKKVYALKITEANTLLNQNNSKSSCQVYSIRKSFPCESSEADIILKETKRKINKKSKKEKSKKGKDVDTKTTVIAPVFRKRQIAESHALEQIMPSIEDNMY